MLESLPLSVKVPAWKCVHALRQIFGVWSSLERKDLNAASQRIAAEESARFIAEYCPQAPQFGDRFELLEATLKHVPASGLCLEFGVFNGTTINFIADRLTRRQVYGFDSFEGLPEDWLPEYKRGAFKVKLPRVRSNVTLVQGWFDKSLPPFLAEHREPVAFLHMDADLYSSTRTVFELLRDRIVPGTVIQFDEYFNYPGWRDGEHKAFQELTADLKLKVEWLGYNVCGDQIALKVLDLTR